MTLREKLERVRDIMRERGTKKGGLGDPGGEVCLVGAVAEVEGRRGLYGELVYPGRRNYVIQALRQGLPKAERKRWDIEGALYNYHDNHTKAASVALVTRAIKALDTEDAAS